MKERCGTDEAGPWAADPSGVPWSRQGTRTARRACTAVSGRTMLLNPSPIPPQILRGAAPLRAHATWRTSGLQAGIARCGLAGPASSSGRPPDSGGAGSCGPPGLARHIPRADQRGARSGAPRRLLGAATGWRLPARGARRCGPAGGRGGRNLRTATFSGKYSLAPHAPVAAASTSSAHAARGPPRPMLVFLSGEGGVHSIRIIL